MAPLTNVKKKKPKKNKIEKHKNIHEPPLCEPPTFDNEAMFDLDVGIILDAIVGLAGGKEEAHDDACVLLVLLLLL